MGKIEESVKILIAWRVITVECHRHRGFLPLMIEYLLLLNGRAKKMMSNDTLASLCLS